MSDIDESIEEHIEELLEALKPFANAHKAHYPTDAISTEDIREAAEVYGKYHNVFNKRHQGE